MNGGEGRGAEGRLTPAIWAQESKDQSESGERWAAELLEWYQHQCGQEREQNRVFLRQLLISRDEVGMR